MPDWMENEVARQLAPVAAPEALGIRLGFRPQRRREWPRMMLAVAAAAVVLIAGGYSAGRANSSDLRQAANTPRATGQCGSCHTL